MANHNMKDSIKDVVKYINDNIKLPEINEALIDNKVSAHAEQVVTDNGGVHGIRIVDGATPSIQYKKQNNTWGEIQTGGTTTFSDQDIADIKAAFDRGLNGEEETPTEP